jgi:hypothetical protein
VAADNRALQGAVSRHKAQLEALRHQDPEFYAYLQVRVMCGSCDRDCDRVCVYVCEPCDSHVLKRHTVPAAGTLRGSDQSLNFRLTPPHPRASHTLMHPHAPAAPAGHRRGAAGV